MGNIPSECRYTNEHEWARDNNGKFVVGITDYAQGELGDVVFVELPSIGTVVEKGKRFASLESVKAVSDVYSPISGKVVEVNERLSDEPELVNTSPYKDGWMIAIEPQGQSEFEKLMDANQYNDFISSGS
jgi:glycine cleavage system H protein